MLSSLKENLGGKQDLLLIIRRPINMIINITDFIEFSLIYFKYSSIVYLAKKFKPLYLYGTVNVQIITLHMYKNINTYEGL